MCDASLSPLGPFYREEVLAMKALSSLSLYVYAYLKCNMGTFQTLLFNVLTLDNLQNCIIDIKGRHKTPQDQESCNSG